MMSLGSLLRDAVTVDTWMRVPTDHQVRCELFRREELLAWMGRRPGAAAFRMAHQLPEDFPQIEQRRALGLLEWMLEPGRVNGCERTAFARDWALRRPARSASRLRAAIAGYGAAAQLRRVVARHKHV